MKKCISIFLSVVLVFLPLSVPASAYEDKTAAEAAAEIVVSRIETIYNEIDTNVPRFSDTSNVFYRESFGFIDVDFDNQLELWVHITENSDMKFTHNYLYDLNDSNLDVLVESHEGFVAVTDKLIHSDPFGTLSLYSDTDGHRFYYTDHSAAGGMPNEDKYITYNMLICENSEIIEKQKFLSIEGTGYSDGSLKNIVYNYDGSVSKEYTVAQKAGFTAEMESFVNSLTDYHLNTKFSDLREFSSMSDTDKRQFLIDSYNTFGYDGFVRDDSNVVDEKQNNTESKNNADESEKKDNTDNNTTKSTDNTDSRTSDDKNAKNYSWYLAPRIEAEDIGVLFNYQPIEKDSDGNWDIYTIDRMNLGKYMPIKKDEGHGLSKYGLIDYNGNIVLEPQFDQFVIGFEGTLFGLNQASDWNKIVYEDENGFIFKNYDTYYMGTNGKAGSYYWINEENSLYKTAGTVGKKVNETRPLIAIEGVVSKYNEVVPWRSIQGKETEGFDYHLVVDNKIVEFEKNSGFAGHGIFGYGHFSDGIIPIMNVEGNWGYCDTKGKIVIPFEYDSAWDNISGSYRSTDKPAYDSSNGYVVLKKGDEYALYTSTGESFIDFGEFEEILPVYSDGTNKLSWVKFGGKWGVIELKEIKDNSESKDSKDSDSSNKKTESKTQSLTVSVTIPESESFPETVDISSKNNNSGNTSDTVNTVSSQTGTISTGVITAGIAVLVILMIFGIVLLVVNKRKHD